MLFLISIANAVLGIASSQKTVQLQIPMFRGGISSGILPTSLAGDSENVIFAS